MHANLLELSKRGYYHRRTPDGIEDEFIRGESLVSIHTVRSSPPDYFKGLIDEKKEFEFEVL